MQQLGVAVDRKGRARRKAIRQVSVIEELCDAFVKGELTVPRLAAREQEDVVNPRRTAGAGVRDGIGFRDEGRDHHEDCGGRPAGGRTSACEQATQARCRLRSIGFGPNVQRDPLS